VPVTIEVFVNTMSATAGTLGELTVPCTRGLKVLVAGCVACKVNPVAGSTNVVPLSPRTPVKVNAPSLFAVRVWVRPNNTRSLVNCTGALGTTVVPSCSKTRPVTCAVSDGSGAIVLRPPSGTTKLRIVAASSGLSPDSASGGNCVSRSAEASAAGSDSCCTPKCMSVTVSPASTLS
jgi:hypothetical protein